MNEVLNDRHIAAVCETASTRNNSVKPIASNSYGLYTVGEAALTNILFFAMLYLYNKDRKVNFNVRLKYEDLRYENFRY